MLDLLTRFAALSMLSGLVMALLPEGSLRRTASMAVGLFMLLFWVQGLQELLLQLPPQADSTALFSLTGVSLSAAEEAAASQLAAEAAP